MSLKHLAGPQQLVCFDGNLVLVSLETGEVVDLSMHNQLALVEEEEGVRVARVDDEGAVVPDTAGGWTASCRDIFTKQLVMQEGKSFIMSASGGRESCEDLRRQALGAAVNFDVAEGDDISKTKVEVYKHACPSMGTTVWWVLRSVTNYLGATRKNFIGDSIPSWANRIEVFVRALGDESEVPAMFKNSILSDLRRADASGEKVKLTDTMRGDTDFSTTTFSLVVLLATWAAKGVHSRSKWSVEHAVVQARATAFLRSFVRKFLLAPFTTKFATSAGEVVISCEVSEGGQVLFERDTFLCTGVGRIFIRSELLNGPKRPNFVDVMMAMAADDVSRNVGRKRKQAAQIVLGCMAAFVALVVEASKLHSLWEESGLAQVPMVASSRGYKRPSPAVKVAVVQACARSKRLRHVSQFLAAKAVIEENDMDADPHNAGDYLKTERYSYMMANLKLFSEAHSLSIVVDGCTASEHFLNVIAWSGELGKVQRELKSRTGVSSRDFLEAEDEWSQKAAMFFQRKEGETDTQKRARLKYNQQTKPRLATLHWLQDVSNSIQALGQQLRDFVGQEVCMEPASVEKPKFLMVCTDQEALQLTAMNFLRFEIGAWVEHCPDPQHRRSNDASGALSEVGLFSRVAFDCTLFNVKYGPFQKSGFHKLLVEVAKHVSDTLSPNDPVLVHFFPRILRDRNMCLSLNVEAERRKFLQELPHEKCLTNKGPKASLSRFNSWTHAFQHWDGHWHTLCFLMVICSLLNNWSKFADEFWAPTDMPVVQPSDPRHGQGQASSSSSSSRAAQQASANEATGGQPRTQASSASSSSAAAPPAQSKLQERLAAKREVEQLRCKSVNTLHAMARAMCDPEVLSETRLIGYLQIPEAVASGRMLREMRGPEATLRYYSQWAHWSFLDELKAQVSVLTDLNALGRIGFEVSLSPGKQVDSQAAVALWEDHMAAMLWRTLRAFLKHRAGSMLWNVLGGGCSAGLLHDDPALARKSLELFRRADAALQRAVDLGGPLLEQMLFGQPLLSRLMSWLRKVLREVNFMQLPGIAREVLANMWSGLLNSKLVEDFNKQIREREQRTSTNKVVARMEAWQTGTHHNLLASYDRPEMTEYPALGAPASFDVARLFEHSCSRSSEDRKDELEMFERVVGPLTWPTSTPASQQQNQINLHLMMWANDEDKWDQVDAAWHSGLVDEGLVLVKGGRYFLTLKRFLRGLLCWPMRRTPAQTLEFDMSVRDLVIVHLFDLDTWEVVSPRCASPLRQQIHRKALPTGCCIKAPAKPMKILDHLINTGFAGVSEDVLRRLHSELAVPEAEPIAEAKVDACLTLSMGLLRQCKPGLTEDEAVARWMKHKFVDESFENAPSIDLDFLRDTVLECDRDKILQSQDKQHQKMEKRKHVMRELAKAARAVYQSCRGLSKGTVRGESMKKGQSAAECKKQQKRLYAELTKDTDAEMKKHLPPDVSVWTDHANGRWKLKYDDVPRARRSISWTNIGMEQASLVLLKQAWEWAETFGGMATPDHLQAAFTERLGETCVK